MKRIPPEDEQVSENQSHSKLQFKIFLALKSQFAKYSFDKKWYYMTSFLLKALNLALKA